MPFPPLKIVFHLYKKNFFVIFGIDFTFLSKENKEDIGLIERWFRDRFSVFLSRNKYAVIIFFLAILIFFIVNVSAISFFHCINYKWDSPSQKKKKKASQLAPDPEPPQFFAPGFNYQEFRPKKAKHFARGPSVFSVPVSDVNKRKDFFKKIYLKW